MLKNCKKCSIVDEPIRILHVLGRLNRGGAETMIMNIYRNIDRSKVQFDFIIHTSEECDYHDEIRYLGGKIFSIPQYSGKNHFSYKNAWQTFFERNPEYRIIHGHVRSTASIYLRIAKKNGLITIAHSHSTASRGTKVERIVKNIIQLPIRYIADYLFACSDEAGKWLFGKKSIKKDNFRIIKNAIDAQNYLFNGTVREEIRKRLGIEDKLVIGHVGNFTYPKNHKFLIEVFNEIQKQNKAAVLLLIGDGELRSQIQKQILSLGVKDKVILTGTVSNVNEYMQAMDVFVFPSKFEGLGIAVIEAQAAGLRCVVSEAVPNEVIVSKLVEYIPLTKKPHEWANLILYNKKMYDRGQLKESVAHYGYDIKDQVEGLEVFYRALY